MTPPETEGIALIMLGYQPFLRGYHWTRNATPQILIFANANNELVGLRGGVNVGRVFTRYVTVWFRGQPFRRIKAIILRGLAEMDLVVSEVILLQ